MRVRLYSDETVRLRLADIVNNLSRIAPSFHFNLGRTPFSISDSFVTYPATYRTLDARIDDETAQDDAVVLFTAKPYDNNFFWESGNKKVIVSLFGWEHLTNLSPNNGAVYFICALLIRSFAIGISHHKNTGCINDFWWDKTGVDSGMRCAFICQECLDHYHSRGTDKYGNLVRQIKAVLDDLSSASRANSDICNLWDDKVGPTAFDVFICHNSDDKSTIREMNRRLQAECIRTWLDEEQLIPGRLWQEQLEAQIGAIRTAAVFVGESGIGPWQNFELRAFLEEFVRRHSPVIPVILSTCQNVPALPLFLRQLMWVDFRKSVPNPWEMLLWGITGTKRSNRQGTPT